MAKTGKNVLGFLKKLADGVDKKFQQEQQELLALKIRETGDKDAVLKYWDGMFYRRILFAEKYQIDLEAMEKYFSMDDCLKGMFKTYEHIFKIKDKVLFSFAHGHFTSL